MDLYYILLLGLTVSIDGFFAGVAYGMKKIRVPLTAFFIIGLVTFFCTSISVGSAFYVGQYIHPAFTISTGACLLIFIGLAGILKEYFSHTFDSKGSLRKITFSCGHLMINIICQPEKADMDCSKRLNWLEALLLGLALGLDNMIAAFSIALTSPAAIYAPFLMGFIQTALVAAGILSASRIFNESWRIKTRYLPGLILIVLGLVRLL